ncbi:nuclear apoptosis-inducing factor 1-like [Sphaeramia orbicularis]|uniref:nuclear apoptosis-inducing factor 1-like n=1 Tax=Sphaeramia orbicularis TaxID=375764 RepID=UPI0011817340|nr:nuclear apoptosis-inducing factor 1-like [Sphaeramia orbicularis]XP_029982482.1 nuclear apoptosis-inducing factor 1-like [Sphaeramia orbicularis]
MASLETRKRKAKFNPTELEVLVDESNKYLHDLQQKNLTLAQRTAIWEKICQKVNAVGRTVRTVDEVKRRYQDIRRRTKEKLAYNRLSANHTGEGQVDPLTRIEEKVQVTFSDEQVAGIAEYDTLDIKIEEETSSEAEQPPPNFPKVDPTPSALQNGPEDINLQLLREQNKQAAALQLIAREMRASASLARAVRRDTQAIATHCRQMVSAVSALTMAVNAVAKELQTMTALHSGAEAGRPSSAATDRQSETEEDGEVHTVEDFHLRKRKRPVVVLKKIEQ